MTRGRSVPATVLSTGSSSKFNDTTKAISTALIPSSSSISPIPTNGPLTTRNGSKLLAQADALARMTIEFNVRAVSAQTERLEKGLNKLMMSTKEDKAFRESHDARLQSLCKEILVVKQRMEEIQGPEWNGNGKDGLEGVKKEVDASIELLKKEMEELKGLVGGISSTLDKLPTAAEAEALIRRTQASVSTTGGREIQTRSKAAKTLAESSKYTHYLSTVLNILSPQSILNAHNLSQRNSKGPSLHQAAYRRCHRLNPPLEPRPQDYQAQRCHLHSQLP